MCTPQPSVCLADMKKNATEEHWQGQEGLAILVSNSSVTFIRMFTRSLVPVCMHKQPELRSSGLELEGDLGEAATPTYLTFHQLVVRLKVYKGEAQGIQRSLLTRPSVFNMKILPSPSSK